MINVRADAPAQTLLDQTAFSLLGATIRDTRRRIVELAEDRSLTLDADLCSRARADLTNPRTRLGAEVAWLPGISPARANAYRVQLQTDLTGVLRAATSEAPLVRANLIAAAMERFDPGIPAGAWTTWILALADAARHIDPAGVRTQLNEDRAVAGFPEIQTLEHLDVELAERRRVYRDTVKDALDRLPTLMMLEVMTTVVATATSSGARPAPLLIDEVVDAFEVGARSFLDEEAENARRLVAAVRESGDSGANVVGRLLDALERVVRNWDRVAQPIQMSMQARGLEHPQSRDLAYEIRGLGVDLFNRHGLLEPAQRITTLLRDIFAESLTLAERLAEDSAALDKLDEQRRQAQAKAEQWASEIAYEAEVGWLFKDTLRISVAGLEWKNTRYPFETITHIGWGATRHSVNGVPTGTTYKVVLSSHQGQVIDVPPSTEQIFNAVVDRLWRAIGLRLLNEMLEGLRDGKKYHFGDGVLDDYGIDLPKRTLFSVERRHGAWNRVHVWSADGTFYIGFQDEKRAYAALPYQEANNAHVLEMLIRAAFKKGVVRLSDTFTD